MTTERERAAQAELARLKFALANDIREMSDKEIRNEAAEIGLDPEHAKSIVLSALEKAQSEFSRAQYDRVRGAGSVAAPASQSSRLARLRGDQARATLKKVADRASNSSALLMAARAETEVPDSEIRDMLQDMLDLGLLSDDDIP